MLGPKPDAPERESWHFEIMNFGDPLGIVRAGAEQGKGRLLAQMIGGTREREGTLMAAALDLLEAAQAAVARMTADCLNMCGGAPSDEICGRIACPVLADIQRLEAAVAKAEGRDAE